MNALVRATTSIAIINKVVRDFVDFTLKEYAGTVGEEYENR